jgi:hypothetical protein
VLAGVAGSSASTVGGFSRKGSGGNDVFVGQLSKALRRYHRQVHRDPSAVLAAVCSGCLARRIDVDPVWLARMCEGLNWTQIDCGDDVMFPGIGVAESPPSPCLGCGSGMRVIAVHPSVAARFGPEGLGAPET